jgi:hypothetical protein
MSGIEPETLLHVALLSNVDNNLNVHLCFDVIFIERMWCDCNNKLLICAWLISYLSLHSRYYLRIHEKWYINISESKIWCFYLFFVIPVLLARSCPSFEAETWRRRRSLALSATGKQFVRDVCVLKCVGSQVIYENARISVQLCVYRAEMRSVLQFVNY